MTEIKLKLLADQIYAAELIIESTNSTQEEKSQAMKKIEILSEKIEDIEDMFELDEMIQKKFKKV